MYHMINGHTLWIFSLNLLTGMSGMSSHEEAEAQGGQLTSPEPHSTLSGKASSTCREALPRSLWDFASVLQRKGVPVLPFWKSPEG